MTVDQPIEGYPRMQGEKRKEALKRLADYLKGSNLSLMDAMEDLHITDLANVMSKSGLWIADHSIVYADLESIYGLTDCSECGRWITQAELCRTRDNDEVCQDCFEEMDDGEDWPDDEL